MQFEENQPSAIRPAETAAQSGGQSGRVAMFPIQEVSDILLAFPASVSDLMPPQKDIPDEFKRGSTRWNKFFSQWFFFGLKSAAFKPKEGVDQTKALRHIRAIMGSYEPKHEHKEAAVAFLLNEWFTDVDYEPATREKRDNNQTQEESFAALT